MRKLLRCRRGAIAFATTVAIIPLIAAISLGGEAASWYVTKQHVQNAADSAAYSGALVLACQTGSGTCSIDTQSISYRGKQFAAQQGYCNSGDTSYPLSRCSATLPARVSQSVTISNTSTQVTALVTQTQPAYLTALLGLGPVTVRAQAVAQVNTLSKPCVLALTGPVTFKDSAVTVNAPGCGIASNATPNSFNFQANPTINAGTLSASGSCSGGSSYCNSVLTYQQPVIDPFTALDTAMNGVSLSACGGATLTAYTAAKPCANKNFSTNSPISITTSGVYFFSGNLKLTGTGAIATASGVSATIILLPGASLSMVGGTSLNITAQTTVPTSELPTALQSVAGLLADMAIYDVESGTPKINGGATITGNGVLYFPNASLNFQGDPTVSPSSCAELIAGSIQFSGTPYFSNSGCPPSVTPKSLYVALVQ